MLGSAFKEVTSWLNRRFLTTIYVPVVLFLTVMIIILGGGDVISLYESWDRQPTDVKWLELAAFFIGAAFIGNILVGSANGIIRFLEGYGWEQWPGGKNLKQGQIEYHKKRREKMDQQDAYLLYPLPTESKLRPTLVGNILRSAEAYPRCRYGMDGSIFWPRIYHILPPEYLERIGSARGSMELMAVMLVLSSSLMLIGGGWLLWERARLLWLVSQGSQITSNMLRQDEWRPWLFLMVFFGGLIVTVGAYRGLVNASINFSLLFRAAFDLYRHKLLETMGIKRRDSLQREKELWQDLKGLIYLDVPITLFYEGEPSKSKENSPFMSFLQNMLAGLEQFFYSLENGKHLAPPSNDEPVTPEKDPTPSSNNESPPRGVKVHSLFWLTFWIGVLISLAMFWWWPGAQREKAVVPVRDLPSYYLVQRNDVMEQYFPAWQVGPDTVKEISNGVGRFTLKSLAAQEPVPASSLSPIEYADVISGTVPISVRLDWDASGIEAGRVVSIWRVGDTEPLWSKVMVLGREDSNVTGIGQENPGSRTSVVIAIPVLILKDVIVAEQNQELKLVFVSK